MSVLISRKTATQILHESITVALDGAISIRPLRDLIVQYAEFIRKSRQSYVLLLTKTHEFQAELLPPPQVHTKRDMWTEWDQMHVSLSFCASAKATIQKIRRFLWAMDFVALII